MWFNWKHEYWHYKWCHFCYWITKTLTGSTNIDITNDVISATGLQTTLTGSTNIDITGGIISAVNLATTTQLGNKQDEINNSVSVSCDTLTTAGNVSIGGVITAPNQIGFLAYSKSASNVSGSNTQKLPYNEVKYNICGHYDTSTYIFTAPVVGIYIFYATYFTVDGQGGTVDLIKKVGTVEFTISRNQEGNNSPGNNEVRRFMIIIDCNAGDQLYALMRNSVIRLSSLNISDDTMFGPYGVQLLS